MASTALSNVLSHSMPSDPRGDLCTALQIDVHTLSRIFSTFLLSDAHPSIKSSDADLPYPSATVTATTTWPLSTSAASAQ